MRMPPLRVTGWTGAVGKMNLIQGNLEAKCCYIKLNILICGKKGEKISFLRPES